MEWLERVELEASELKDKLDKLYAFILSRQFKQLHVSQRAMLPIQHDAMNTYLTILNTRIALARPLTSTENNDGNVTTTDRS